MIKKILLSICLLTSLSTIVANVAKPDIHVHHVQDKDKEKIEMEILDFFSDDIDRLPPPTFEEKAKIIIYLQQIGAYMLCKYVDSCEQVEYFYNTTVRILNLIRYNI